MLKSISLFLIVLAETEGESTKESFLEKLFPNPWDALAVFLAFLVLVLVAFFFAYKPVKEIIRKRHEYVDSQVSEADKKVKEANLATAKAQEELRKSRQEGMAIVAKAQEDAEEQRKIIKEKAKKDSDAEMQRAREEIAREIEAKQDAIHKEIVDVAIDASSKVLGREVTDKDNERLVDEFVKELDAKGEK